jgi:hypothetical protein
MVQTADEGLAGKVDRYSQDLVAIELHSDRVGSPGEDSIWRRRLSARAADRLLRHSQTVALELLDDIADSLRGELRCPRKLGAREGAIHA